MRFWRCAAVRFLRHYDQKRRVETKLFVSESLVKVALDTVQIHGGYGYMVEYEVERALRDAVGSTLYSGTSEMQRSIIAR
ncbi:MAG: acyl-CoA dehydrogenase family protein [Rhodoferax sp.]